MCDIMFMHGSTRVTYIRNKDIIIIIIIIITVKYVTFDKSLKRFHRPEDK